MINGIDSTSSLRAVMQTRMQKPPAPPKFEDMDTNGDGGIDKTEFVNSHKDSPMADKLSSLDDEIFAILDSNSDGSITQTEMDTNQDAVKEFIDSKIGPPPSPPPMMKSEEDSSDEDSLIAQFLKAYSQNDLSALLNSISTVDITT